MSLPSQFPELPLIVEAAFGADVDDPTSWSWVDLSDRRLTQTVKVARGRQDESSRTQPAKTSLQLLNNDGHLTPDHPGSPWWPDVVTGTPLRLRLDRTVLTSLPAAESWAQLITLDDQVSAPADASFNGGDLRVAVQFTRDGSRFERAVDSVILASRWDQAGNVLSWALSVSERVPALSWSPDGTSALAALGTAPMPDDHEALRVTLDVDDGGGGWTATFESAETVAGPWSQLGALDSGTPTTSVFGVSLPIVLGGLADSFADYGVDGRLLAATVEIDGVVVADPDLRDLDAGTSSFADSEGNTWTLGGNAQVVRDDPAIRFLGQIASLAPTWPHGDQSTGGDARVGVSAAGVLRRLTQGSSAVQSPIRREILGNADAFGLAHYLPLEDGPDAERGEVAFGGDDVLRPAVGWADNEPGSLELTGSQPVLGVPAGGHGGTAVGGMAVASPWAVYAFVSYGPPSSGGGVVFPFVHIDVTGGVHTPSGDPFAYYAIGYDDADASFILELVDSEAVVVASVSMPVDDGTLDLLSHDWLQLGCGINATDDAVFLVAEVAGRPDLIRATTGIGVVPGTVTTVYYATVGPRAGQSLGVGHMTISETRPEAANADGARAYAGERAGRRVARLCGEVGLPFELVGAAEDTAPMGPQGTATLLPLLRECVDADRGILAERDDLPGLVFRTRFSLYNQPARLALDAGRDADPWRPGDIVNPLSPTADDQRLRNDVTVQRQRASAQQAVDEASVTRRGRYDVEHTLNVAADAQLAPLARWLLHIGTWPGMRYPPVTSELTVARDGIAADWATVRLGDRITIDGLPAQHPPGTVGLLAQQLVDTITPARWTAQAACIPAGPYEVGVRDDADRGKRDSGFSTLAADFEAGTDTSMSVAVSAGLLWTTAAGDVPFDLDVGGVRLTVTAISGASSPQTFTVNATPVNGITKTVPAGTAVGLWRPTIRAL